MAYRIAEALLRPVFITLEASHGLDQSLQEVAFGVSDFGRSYSKTGHTLPVENMHLCIKPVPLPKK